jgi:hypothetical protein
MAKKRVHVIDDDTRDKIGSFYTVKEAEAFIAGMHVYNRAKVESGAFSIDAPEELVNPK